MPFEFGISIPMVNDKRNDINTKKLVNLQEKNRCRNLKINLAKEMTTIMDTLKMFIRQYNLVAERRERSHAASSLKIYQQLEGIDPLTLLRLKESILESELTINDIRHKIFLTYIRFLDLSGRLSEKPLENHLSKNMEKINL